MQQVVVYCILSRIFIIKIITAVSAFPKGMHELRWLYFVNPVHLIAIQCIVPFSVLLHSVYCSIQCIALHTGVIDFIKVQWAPCGLAHSFWVGILYWQHLTWSNVWDHEKIGNNTLICLKMLVHVVWIPVWIPIEKLRIWLNRSVWKNCLKTRSISWIQLNFKCQNSTSDHLCTIEKIGNCALICLKILVLAVWIPVWISIEKLRI